MRRVGKVAASKQKLNPYIIYKKQGEMFGKYY